MSITIKQIESFLALIRYNNLTKAAEALGLSQPAVSKTIAALEKQLGNQLFHRNGQRLILNEHGKALIPCAKQVMDSIWNLERRLQSSYTKLKGTLTIGCTTSISNTILVPFLDSFMRKHPLLKIRLQVSNYQHTLESLLNFEIDMGLVASDCVQSSVETELWKEDILYMCCSMNHPALQITEASKDILARQTWIVRETGSGSRILFDKISREADFNPNISLEMGSNEAIRIAILNGMGLGCLSMLLIQNDVQSGKIVLLDLPDMHFKRPLNMITLANHYQSPAVSQFKNYLRQN